MPESLPNSSKVEKNSEFSAIGKFRVGGSYAKYVLGLLIVVYVINLVDRQILSILAEEIKSDLGVSDSQLGFLYGTSFAVFYAVFGLPLGRLADLWIRKSLIAIGLFGWSLMTMLSGTAGGILSLTLYRFGVGIAQGSATPSAYSLLADWFKPSQRATVLSLYSSGAFIGMGVSLFLGGWIVDSWNLAYPQIADAPFGLKGWQVTFLMIGFPGILLAILFNTLKEPERGYSEGIKSQKHPHPFRESFQELLAVVPPFSVFSLYSRGGGKIALIINVAAAMGLVIIASLLIVWTGNVSQWTVLAIGIYSLFSWAQCLKLRDLPAYTLIFRSRAMIYANIAFPTIAFITYGYGFWIAPYFIRKFDIGLAEAGMVLGLSTAIGGGVGVTVGGVLADFMRTKARDAHVYMAMLVAIFTTASALVLLNTNNLNTAYTANALLQFVSVMWSGAAASIITELVLPRMRAAATAFYLAMATFLGLAMGPYLIGRLSDAFIASGLEAAVALGESLRVGLFVFVPAIVFAFLTKRHFLADLDGREERARAAGEPD